MAPRSVDGHDLCVKWPLELNAGRSSPLVECRGHDEQPILLAGCRKGGTASDRCGEFAGFAPGDKSEDALAFGAFVVQHLVPVPDRRGADQGPFNVAYDANGFSAHGR